MRLQEFLNTSDFKWEAILLYTDDEEYVFERVVSCEAYTDMRDIPDIYLRATVDRWGVNNINGNVPHLTLLITI